MPEWLHLLGVGVVLAGCGWIGFAPINVEWFWVPHDDDLAVIIIGPRAASCDAEGGEGAACYLHQQDWGVPVKVTADGVRTLTLPLSAS